MTKQFIFSLVLLLLTFQSNSLLAQSSTSAIELEPVSIYNGGVPAVNTIFKNLEQQELLQIVIEMDINHLIENKIKDEYQEASLTINNELNAETYPIKVKPRGRFRRMNCDFPPLKVKFQKGDLKERGIATKHKSLKLVTHCLEDESAGQNVIKEYLAYKMYNTLTEVSFNVQLVEVTYVDINDESMSITNYGFLIEDTDEMAERIGGTEVENAYNTTLADIQKSYSHMVPMFQYMIANMDWKPEMLQNVKIIEKNTGERIIVPYDFDFSGLVEAPYAIPSVDYQQQNIRQRIYMNKVDNLDELEATIKYFKIHKKEVINTIVNCEFLTKENKRSMVKYIKEFYRTLESSSQCLEAFVK